MCEIKKSLRAGILAAALVFLLSSLRPVDAQVLYGSLVGNVRDPSGAAVPGATVSATQQETDQTRSTTTNQTGEYSLTTLAAGTYVVRISAQGFKTSSRTGVQVAINSVTRVDATLELGAVSQSVEVSAAAAVLQTERADVHHDLTAATIENVPVPPGNNFEHCSERFPDSILRSAPTPLPPTLRARSSSM